MGELNIPTILLIVALIAFFLYWRRKKQDFVQDWAQFAEANSFQFDADAATLTGVYRGYNVLIGPEQVGRVTYGRFGANGGAMFETQMVLTLQNPGRLKLRRFTSSMLNGENDVTKLLTDYPDVKSDFAQLKTPDWVVRVQGKNLKYTQSGVEHNTSRLLHTLNLLIQLADIVEALPESDMIEIEPEPTPVQRREPFQVVTVLNTDPKKHPLSR